MLGTIPKSAFLRLIFQSNSAIKKEASTLPKACVTLDENVRKSIEEMGIKPKRHPGIIKIPTIELPEKIKKGINSVVQDTPMKQLLNESSALSRFLHSRLPPTDEQGIRQRKSEIKQEVEEKLPVDKESFGEEELKCYNKKINSKVEIIFKQRVYNWKPLEFTRHTSLVYMVARAAPQFAVMKRIFKELSNLENQFQPKTLFDFGSGIGTVSWAALEVWGNSIREYFSVDSSGDMNDISKELLDSYNENISKIMFYRQFLPVSSERKYDVVVSSYSLLELPSAKSRIQTLLNLWNKTEKYLVLVEYGSMAGFKILDEARDFLLSGPKFNEEFGDIHVVAPCPHDLECPRIKQDQTPCNFEVSFYSFPQKEIIKKEMYSYLILKKGERNLQESHWPRIVRPVLLRSRHVICRLCTEKGNLQEVIFTPTKHGKTMYKCARSSSWGDVLPIKLENAEEKVEGNS